MIRWCFKIPDQFVSFILPDEFRVVLIALVRMVKFQLLVQFPVDYLPYLSYLVLYSLYANLLHLLIILLIVLSLSPHNLYLLFYSVLSFFFFFCFKLVGPFDIVLCCYKKRFSFSFLTTSKFFRVRFRFRLFAAWNIHRIAFLPIFVF